MDLVPLKMTIRYTRQPGTLSCHLYVNLIGGFLREKEGFDWQKAQAFESFF
jgi:hypothetical protein